MSDQLNRFRHVRHPLPEAMWTWPLTGVGLDHLGHERKAVTAPMPDIGPDELLLRVDAVGLCFSDTKVIAQGPDHPRLYGRDLKSNPVILGHEAAMTVMRVGSRLTGRFHLGERYIIQADIIYRGQGLAFGYALPGAMRQYAVVGPEVINGDEGCYLLPLNPETGYAEAALSEPWACVEHSYSLQYRAALQDGGTLLIAGGKPGVAYSFESLAAGGRPKRIVLAGVPQSVRSSVVAAFGSEAVSEEETPLEPGTVGALLEAHGGGFTDVVLLDPGPDAVAASMKALARGAALALVCTEPRSIMADVDVGRVHYENWEILGTTSLDVAQAYAGGVRTELKAGGKALFIGAGGPMGRMHVQRAIQSASGPSLVVASDTSDERLESLRTTFGPDAERRKVSLVCVNPASLGPEQYDAFLRRQAPDGYDDIVLLAPVAKLITTSVPHLAHGGTLNIFAGLARGSMAEVDACLFATKGIHFTGSSGSFIADLQAVLAKAERGDLAPEHSVAAIGGIHAGWDGMEAVINARFPGKIVLYPQIEDLPLTSLADLHQVLPDVAAKLDGQGRWTNEAEEELLRRRLSLPAGITAEWRQLVGQSAVVTGAAQGLGEAIARRLAREGANVVLGDLNLPRAQEVAQAIERQYGTRALAIRMDVTDEDSVRDALRLAVAEFGRLDIMVSNAGILQAFDIAEFPADVWRRVIEVNLTGYFICAREAARIMKEQGSGVILQINSKSGKKGSFRNSAYASSKFGGIGLTQSIALDLAPYNIRVNSICPGNLLDSPLWVDSLYEQYARKWGITPAEVRERYRAQVPLGRGCTYEDVTNVLVFLASPQASYMTGQAINVTGGQEMR
ncbi:MAG: sorbitol-6-phosphate dehydrogenase [Anaerolineae bacterium]|nr:sorbitol-6-phosphate dehydrogenase [Anaerolineae bacterium]